VPCGTTICGSRCVCVRICECVCEPCVPSCRCETCLLSLASFFTARQFFVLGLRLMRGGVSYGRRALSFLQLSWALSSSYLPPSVLACVRLHCAGSQPAQVSMPVLSVWLQGHEAAEERPYIRHVKGPPYYPCTLAEQDLGRRQRLSKSTSLLL
jgi:hypothetical protein